MLAIPNEDFPRVPPEYEDIYDCFQKGFDPKKLPKLS